MENKNNKVIREYDSKLEKFKKVFEKDDYKNFYNHFYEQLIHHAIPLSCLVRLEKVLQFDKQWGEEILNFVCDNIEFASYLKYTPLNRKLELPEGLDTVKKMLKYYVSYAGVRAEFGSKVFFHVQKNELEKIPPRKKIIIQEIDKLNEIKTVRDLYKIEIKGIGEGAVNFVKQHFFHEKNITYPMDRVFQRGMKKIYAQSKLTISKCRKITEQWIGNKSIGSMFCFQAAHYAS